MLVADRRAAGDRRLERHDGADADLGQRLLPGGLMVDAATQTCRRRRSRADRPGRRTRCARWSSAAGPGGSSPRCAPRWSCSSCSRWPPCPARWCRSTASTPSRVAQLRRQHPHLAPWYDRLSCSTSSPRPGSPRSTCCCSSRWSGCVVPRSRLHWRGPAQPAAGRAAQPGPAAGARRRGRRARRAPVLDAAVPRAAAAPLPRRRRADGARSAPRRASCARPATCSSTSRSVGAARRCGHRKPVRLQGTVLVVEGDGFSNSRARSTTPFAAGARFADEPLPPFTFDARRADRALPALGRPARGTARLPGHLSYTSDPGLQPRSYDLQVNHPLVIDGTKVFLIGNGYAPVFTVRDSSGQVVFSGPVPFLPRDGNITSIGVVKASGAQPKQLGFEGLFLPTAAIDPSSAASRPIPACTARALLLTPTSATSASTAGRRSRSTGSTRHGLTQVRTRRQPAGRGARPRRDR